MDLSSAKKLSQVFGSPKEYKVNFVSLTAENVLIATKSLDGQFILIPKEGENVWTGIQKYIYEQIADFQNYTETLRLPICLFGTYKR